ncbi:hypothetical protein OZX65_03280 [Leuconostocaceae bacterium ESL0723]|nr:hypothetical protein [Lactobacillaceae bacterium L1_55_11]WEV55094.1 hypothetical protein OZX65_03280 [Leuconostocaceae bacterium ESL0723]
MNVPVNPTPTSAYFQNYAAEARNKFNQFLVQYRENILNNRDQRVAATEGRPARPRYSRVAKRRAVKQAHARNDRYAYALAAAMTESHAE